MIMFKPKLFQDTNAMPKKDTEIFLEKYAKKINWQSNDTIIDIGCGDGGTTGVLLKKYIPHDYKKLVGCDKSEKMVNYANQIHSDERTSFILLDIEGQIPKNFKGVFNHAFTFFLQHWIRDLELTSSNIYDLLADGGDCLQIFFAEMPVYEVFKILSTRSKWNSYLSDIQSFMPVYFNSKDQIKLFRDIMEKTGFKNVEVTRIDTSFTFQKEEDFKRLIEAVNPFEMPSAVLEEFLTEFVEEAKEIKAINADSKGLLLKYSLLETYGTK